MNAKIVIVLFLITGAIYSVLSVTQNTPLVEGWWGNIQLGTKVDPNVMTKCGFQSIPLANMPPAAGFVVPGKRDTVPPPRFSSEGFSGSIKYNLPNQSEMGFNPNKPIDVEGFANVVEPFKQFKSARADLMKKNTKCYDDMQMPLPTEGFEDATLNVEQPSIYDRLIYALPKSQNYRLEDGIRGPLFVQESKIPYFKSRYGSADSLALGYLNVDPGAAQTAMNTNRNKSMYTTGTANSIALSSGVNQTGEVIVNTFPSAQ